MERSIPGRESNNNQNFWAKSALKNNKHTHTPSWGNSQKEGESMNGKVYYSKC